MVVNRKRVSRIMREDHLLAIQPKAFVVTTDFDHELEVYLNIASRMKLTGINQLKRVLVDKTLELDFFKGALQKVEARRRSNSGTGETASTTRSGS